MEPDRVRAYLQAACAGLGFDIGEIWWTSTEDGSSTVAAIEEDVSDHSSEDGSLVPANGRRKKKLRFVQLYTSKSYESRRNELVNPPEYTEFTDERGYHRSNSTETLQQHVLSPRLVEAISQTTQVVWANSQKNDGLLGRSDIRLQTAVGMPVAVDAEGNMCVVVMFSPNNVHSTDDAMEYLQSLSQSATSSSIPCLLPVFDPNQTGVNLLPPSDSHHSHLVHPGTNALGEGVSARFVSLDDSHHLGARSEPEVHNEHELLTAPKDTFGIPMLPSFAELGDTTPTESGDAFDEASYGIWSTIMDALKDDPLAVGPENFDQNALQSSSTPYSPMFIEGEVVSDPALQVVFQDKPPMAESRREHLEEFLSAFLGMSVFDLADVWVPAGDSYPDCLRHVTTVTFNESPSSPWNDFRSDSENTLIKSWTGAVGRAHSSGNPVWSANPNVFVDPGRAAAFQKARIQTVLAVPVFSGKERKPACVVACYAMVRSGSVPFVLKFVQQALRLLWDGLEKVEPHESVDRNVWEGVAPADLGEMAADVEMQQHFMTKKRPHAAISVENAVASTYPTTNQRSTHLQQVTLPNGDVVAVPLNLADAEIQEPVSSLNLRTVQSHIYEAVRSVGEAVPFDQHMSTNADGTKRAHIMAPLPEQGHSPLLMPRGFPTHVVSASSSRVNSVASTPSTSPPSLSVPQQQDVNAVQVNQPQLVQSMQPTPVLVPAPAVGIMNQYCVPTQPMEEAAPTAPSASVEKLCRIQGCDEPAVVRRPFCVKHSGNRVCEHDGCTKCAQGSTRFCIAHGGGRRCTYPGCDKGARDKFFCAAHGGGRRCICEGCTKSAVGGSSLCTAHGGGRRCAVEGCDKSAQSSTKFCVKHGGGKKCAHPGCVKVARGRTMYCAAHGGGIRCKLEGCNRVAVGKLQLCRSHGGGSSRGRKPPPMQLPPQPPQQEGVVYRNNGGIAAGVPMDYMASV